MILAYDNYDPNSAPNICKTSKQHMLNCSAYTEMFAWNQNHKYTVSYIRSYILSSFQNKMNSFKHIFNEFTYLY